MNLMGRKCLCVCACVRVHVHVRECLDRVAYCSCCVVEICGNHMGCMRNTFGFCLEIEYESLRDLMCFFPD